MIFAFTSGHWRSSEYSYDAYGNGKISYDYFSANPNPIRYSGQYYDTESGMTYLRARYYDPYQRRFISEDPAKDGVNWYAYCGNNPVKYVDPTGLYYLEEDDDGQIYAVIESGDTLAAIAKAEVNDAAAYTKMTEVSDFDNIYVGQRVNITNIYNSSYPKPNLLLASNNGDSTANNRRPSTGEPGSTYTNQKGESRIYGPDGTPELDIDQPHGHNPEPHIHRWRDGVRGPAEPIPNNFYWGSVVIGVVVTLAELAAIVMVCP